MPVIAVARQVEVDAKGMDSGFLGARQGETAAGRMPDIVEVIRLAGAVARGHPFDLEGDKLRDRDAAGQSGHREFDRLERDATEIADQVLPDDGRRAAGLAASDGGERLALRRIGRLVDD